MPVVYRALTASAILLTAAAGTPAAAQNVIDQQQPTVSGMFTELREWVAQTFTPAGTNVSGVGAFLVTAGTVNTGSVTLALWSGNPSIPASQQLASQTVSSNVGGRGWADAFWSPVAVIPGQTYWLLIGGGGIDAYTVYGPTGSYANGSAYYTISTDIRHTYTNAALLDLTFRTYTSVGVSAVPEPGTWALLGTGLLGIGGLAARRRRSSTV